MSEGSLMRSPFAAADELTIISMARWMRFIAIVTIISGLLTFTAVIVGVFFVGLMTVPLTLRVGHGADLLVVHRGYLMLGACFALALSLVNLYIGSVLYQAADAFDRVAQTDEADQKYLAFGVERLKRYFQTFVVLAILAFLVGVAVVAGFAIHAATA